MENILLHFDELLGQMTPEPILVTIVVLAMIIMIKDDLLRMMIGVCGLCWLIQ